MSELKFQLDSYYGQDMEQGLDEEGKHFENYFLLIHLASYIPSYNVIQNLLRQIKNYSI